MVNKINNNIKTVFILVSFLILCLFPNYSKSNTNYTLSTVTKVEPIFLSVKKNQPYEICKSVTVPITEYNDKVSPGDVIKGGIIGGIIGNNIPGEKNSYTQKEIYNDGIGFYVRRSYKLFDHDCTAITYDQYLNEFVCPIILSLVYLLQLRSKIKNKKGSCNVSKFTS